MLVIKTDVTYTVTHQTTHMGRQNALSTRATRSRPHSKPVEAERAESTIMACRPWARTKVLARKREQRPPCGPRRASARKVTLSHAVGWVDKSTQLNEPNPCTTQPNPKSTILKMGPLSDTRTLHLPELVPVRHGHPRPPERPRPLRGAAESQIREKIVGFQKSLSNPTTEHRVSPCTPQRVSPEVQLGVCIAHAGTA